MPPAHSVFLHCDIEDRALRSHRCDNLRSNTFGTNCHIFFLYLLYEPTKPLLLIPNDRLHISYHHAKTKELKLITIFCVVPNWSHQKLLQQRDALTFNERSKYISKHTVIKIKHKQSLKRDFVKTKLNRGFLRR
jgi:hypothetical protein